MKNKSKDLLYDEEKLDKELDESINSFLENLEQLEIIKDIKTAKSQILENLIEKIFKDTNDD